MGEMLAGRPSKEAFTSSILAWEEVSTGRGGASDLWGGDMTASTVAAFPMGECSDSWLDSSAITWVRRSLTSAAMLTLCFWGVGGKLAAEMVCTLSTSKVVHSGSSLGGGGILILMYGFSFVVMLALLCSSSGKVVVTSLLFPFRPTG